MTTTDDLFDPQLHDFLNWRSTTGPRERGASATLAAITARIEAPSRPLPWLSGQSLHKAIVAVAIVVAVALGGAFLAPKLPSLLPPGTSAPTATSPQTAPSPTPAKPDASATPSAVLATPAQSLASCPTVLAHGTLDDGQDTAPRPFSLSGNMEGGALAFGFSAYPGSNGAQTIWFANGDLSNPRLLATVESEPGASQSFTPYVRSIAANGSALLASVTADQTDPFPCQEWYRVATTGADSVTRVLSSSVYVWAAALSPDGQRTAVAWTRSGSTTESYLDVLDARGASLASTLVPDLYNPTLAWSADSQRVAIGDRGFVAERVGSEPVFEGTWRIPTMNGHGPTSLVWPSLDQLVYSQSLASSGSLISSIGVATIDLITGQPTTANVGKDSASMLLLSPDGSQLYASDSSFPANLPTGTVIYLDDKSRVIPISGFGGASVVAQWSADSKTLAFAGPAGQIARINRVVIGSNQPTQIAELQSNFGGDGVWLVNHLAWVGP